MRDFFFFTIPKEILPSYRSLKVKDRGRAVGGRDEHAGLRMGEGVVSQEIRKLLEH